MTYLVYDIETEPSRARITKADTRPGESIDQAFDRIEKAACKPDQIQSEGQCFIPARYHVPRVIGLLAVDQSGRYINSAVLSHATDWASLTRQFWDIYTQLNSPCLVSFSGNQFDNVVMGTAALELGLRLPNWFLPLGTPIFKDPRSFNQANERTFDLRAWMGGNTVGGSLDFWSRLVGLPGKGDVHGDSVKSMLEANKIEALADYCASDVANTYGVLRAFLACSGSIQEPALGPTYLDTIQRFLGGRGGDAKRYLDSTLNNQLAAGVF